VTDTVGDLASVLLECGALLRDIERKAQEREWAAEESRWKTDGVFAPGDEVVYKGTALYSMGCIASDLAGRSWTIVACSCDLCATGRHVLRDDGRHSARAALRHRWQPCGDDVLRAIDADEQMRWLVRGLAEGLRSMGAI
jgi:hypothetical protein